MPKKLVLCHFKESYAEIAEIMLHNGTVELSTETSCELESSPSELQHYMKATVNYLFTHQLSGPFRNLKTNRLIDEHSS
jgi:hypothetical protein